MNTSSQTSGAIQPLYEPHPADAYVAPLSTALLLAREDLAVHQGANIHDHQAMIAAAVTLEIRLRGLLAALDADGIGRTDSKQVAA